MKAFLKASHKHVNCNYYDYMSMKSFSLTFLLIFLAFNFQSLASLNCSEILATTKNSSSKLMQPVIAYEKLNLGGGTDPLLVTFEDGSQGVFKPESQTNRKQRSSPQERSSKTYNYEIAAYKISELTGIKMVPETIKRTLLINGILETGSLQLFKNVPDMSRRSFRLRLNQGDLHLALIFDFIIKNRDRGLSNTLKNSNGRLFLVDHGLAFMRAVKEVEIADTSIEFLKNNERGIWFIQKLEALTPEVVTNEIPELSYQEVESLFNRINFLINKVKS